MSELEQLLYTARVRTLGGREGTARSSDGRLDVKLSPPGSAGGGTNPEQLLAAGWSACFISAIRWEADRMRVALPRPIAIDAEVDLRIDQGSLALATRFSVTLSGIDRGLATQILEAAHQSCPYCRATRNTVGVAVTLAQPS